MSFGARAVIRPEALTANYNLLKQCAPGSRVLAAVKANAYGHGIVTASRVLEDADALAVARMDEARKLRDASVDTPVVLMGGVASAEELDEAVALGCDLVVHAAWQVELLEGNRVEPRRVWLKVDTGMHRLGVYPEEAPALCERLRSCGSVGRLGLMTHLANADDTGDSATREQLERFRPLASPFDGDISVANSAALLGWRETLASAGIEATGESWIRPGVSLYGVSPLNGRSAAELGLEPVMNFDTTLIAVKPLAAGEGVGYGGTWSSAEDTVLGIAAVGYGDGYTRSVRPGAPVLVNGRRAVVAGVVSMDLMAIDLGPDAKDRPGDPVRLWGQGLPVEEIAEWADTTSYALVTGVRDRSGRLG